MDKPLLTFKQIAAAFGDVPSDRADAGACVPLQEADGGVAGAGQQHWGGGSQETVKTFVSCILSKLGLRDRVQVGRVRPPRRRLVI
jgi:hypothetical protein